MYYGTATTKLATFTGTLPTFAYKYGFNGKENDDEIGIQDYGMRMYNPKLARFISVDPITALYPELTPFQFASNTPIQAIDLDGLEGFQYFEVLKMKNHTTVTKRVVEVDIYVAVSRNVDSKHFKSTDISNKESNLKLEYNNGFKDASGNIVEFRFNIQEFDADNISPDDFVKQLKKDPNNLISINCTTTQKGFVLERCKLRGNEGSTLSNHVRINCKAEDPNHTITHEVCHEFLNYDYKNNPKTVTEHNVAGGILKYKEVDTNGTIISPSESVNQRNVDAILKSLPETINKTIEEK